MVQRHEEHAQTLAMCGYGPSLDFIVFNNVTFTINYGITQTGIKGIFFDGGFNF